MLAGLRHLATTTTTTTNRTTTERDSTILTTTTETRQPTIGNIREISESTTPVIAENILRISRTTLIIIENITKNTQYTAQQQTKTIKESTRRILRETMLA